MIGNISAGLYGTGAPPAPLSSYESIATVSLGSAQSTITFTSIPSTYKHLQLRYIAKTTSDDVLTFRANGDTGSNYTIHRLLGNGSSASATATVSYNYGGIGVLGGTADCFAGGVCDILDYASTTKNKTFRILNGRENNTSGVVELRSTLWASTSAITQLDFYTDNATNFSQYSSFALYGIKD